MSTIDALEAGRELDALVAEKVMGWKWHYFRDDGPKEWGGDREIRMLRLKLNVEACTAAGWRPIDPSQVSENVETLDLHSVPEYSTDIAAAWEVIDAFGINWTLYTMDGGRQCSGAIVFLPSSPTMSDVGAECEVTIYEKGKMPLAICLAALKAVDATPAERRVQYRERPSPPYVQAEIDRGLKLGKKAAEISERKKGGCEPRQ